jgi:RND family efflux transporter MFP subunit
MKGSNPVKTTLPPALLALALAAGAAGCAREETASASAPAVTTVQLARENVATATVTELTAGPAVSGQLTPAREATVRAQVGGSIVALPFDRGQAVRAGAVVARVSSRDLDEAFASAQAAVRSAETALNVARSELQRTESLVAGGALAARDLEQAKNAVANAEAQLAAARAREKSVWQQRDDTTIRAPFSGVVSDRPANLGDVITPGTALLTIIDPSSLRLEALVPSDDIASVRRGAPVHFTIRGVPGRAVTGTVDRISPTADPVTRQVALFVTLPNVDGRLIAGLFAEGRVETSRHQGVVVPLAAVDETGPVPVVTRIREGKAERVEVTLGVRQADTERVEIASGVAAGDVLVLGSAKGIAPGTPVTVVDSHETKG